MNPWFAAFLGLVCGIPIGMILLLAVSLITVSSVESRREEHQQAESRE